VAEQFGESACGKSPKASEYNARVIQIKASVKAAVITERLKIAERNEATGGNEQLVQCREGVGGIEMVLGGAKPGQPAAPGAKPGAPRLVSTEMDIALALDLIDLVNQAPKDQDAPTNLNNACVVYEKLFQFGEATKCYERLARDYPQSNLAKDAVWNAARNHRRFFNFDKAVVLYQQIATDPKYADYEHRKDALGLAAQLLDNDFSGLAAGKPVLDRLSLEGGIIQAASYDRRFFQGLHDASGAHFFLGHFGATPLSSGDGVGGGECAAAGNKSGIVSLALSLLGKDSKPGAAGSATGIFAEICVGSLLSPKPRTTRRATSFMRRRKLPFTSGP
jgi:tetratricopeptide (TPR) repeat protein